MAVAYLNHLVLFRYLKSIFRLVRSCSISPCKKRGKGCKTNSLSCCSCLMNLGSQFVAAGLPCLLVQCWLACNVVFVPPCATTSLPAVCAWLCYKLGYSSASSCSSACLQALLLVLACCELFCSFLIALVLACCAAFSCLQAPNQVQRTLNEDETSSSWLSWNPPSQQISTP